MTNRRGFLGACVALVAAPFVPKTPPPDRFVNNEVVRFEGYELWSSLDGGMPRLLHKWTADPVVPAAKLRALRGLA